MRVWKALGLAVVGVGAVAAAPFTGGGSLFAAGVSLAGSLAGAATVGAAVAAGSAGAVAGAVWGKKEEEEREREVRWAREEGVAAGTKVANDKWQTKLADMNARLKTYENFGKKLVGLFAVGMAVADADGIISEEEIAELDALVSGISASSLPDDVKEAIKTLRADPPNFSQAMTIARDNGCSVEDVDVVIEVMANADKVVTPEEEAFIARWSSEFRPRMAQ